MPHSQPVTAASVEADSTDPRSVTAAPTATANLLADTVFAHGLGSDPTGLTEDTADTFLVEDLLPIRQRMSDAMLAAHASVDTKIGVTLLEFNVAELQALKTQLALREKQLLIREDHRELFAPIDPAQHGFGDSTIPSTVYGTDPQPVHQDTVPAAPGEASTERAPEDPACRMKLSLVEYAQIREESADLDDVVTTRATADLVKLLRQPGVKLKLPGRRRGKTPLNAATSFVATALRQTFATVDRRITAAAAMWPARDYRRTKLRTPRLAAQLEQGRIPLSTAASAQDKLSDMRQAVRRAGGDAATADGLVTKKEQEFIRQAAVNNPHTFARYATAQRDAVTKELIGPQKTLTTEQVKHEKGLFYDGPIGDRLHKITAIVDDSELLHLNALREFATKLDSKASTLRAQAHQDQAHEDRNIPPLSTDEATAADDVDLHPRITSEDIDYGIAQLFDGQTRAERWLNTLFDFVSAGLILHKTYDPHATEEEQRRRNAALYKTAEHSKTVADILGMDYGANDSTTASPNDANPPSGEAQDPLVALVPPGYELIRPNLEMIVEISLADLVGEPRDRTHDGNSSEIDKVVKKIIAQQRGPTVPKGSPGEVKIDYGLARQQACNQRIIPMVMGSASQPLDVGRAQRLFTPAIRRALHLRDKGCIVPGCPRPASMCEAHHLETWEEGGPTSLANAALLCRQHHGAVHDETILLHMEDDGLPSVSLPTVQDPTQARYRNVYWQN